jgi:hypothetical protein
MIKLLSRFSTQAAQPRSHRQSVTHHYSTAKTARASAARQWIARWLQDRQVCKEGLQPCPIHPATATTVPVLAIFIVLQRNTGLFWRAVQPCQSSHVWGCHLGSFCTPAELARFQTSNDDMCLSIAGQNPGRLGFSRLAQVA